MSILSDARKLRPIIEQAVQSVDGNDAVTARMLYPAWATDTTYTVGFKAQYADRLWRCIQQHTAMSGWEPENATSLWEVINETHSGTMDDPIPYNGNMALEQGLYYIQNDVIYLCIRDTVSPVYNDLSALVGIYVEAV